MEATEQTRFGLGSVSKTLTMAATLVDEGLPDLDTPIEEVLPGFPARGHGVTLRRIAVHQSGISDAFATEHYSTRDHFATLESAGYLSTPGDLARFGAVLLQPGLLSDAAGSWTRLPRSAEKTAPPTKSRLPAQPSAGTSSQPRRSLT